MIRPYQAEVFVSGTGLPGFLGGGRRHYHAVFTARYYKTIKVSTFILTVGVCRDVLMERRCRTIAERIFTLPVAAAGSRWPTTFAVAYRRSLAQSSTNYECAAPFTKTAQ
jgi:hypothetical protein